MQTKDTVILLNEMVHDARVVRMNAEHLPPTIRKWMGDSVGRWDGDTLVVDTTNFTSKTRYNGSGEQLHVVERFTRTDANTVLYRFTVEDPTTWDRSWTGEYPWRATDEKLYEYACHEGNYSLGGMLRGARQKEADDAAAKKTISRRFDGRQRFYAQLGCLRIEGLSYVLPLPGEGPPPEMDRFYLHGRATAFHLKSQLEHFG